jgi:hypothetical protein
MNLRHKKMEAFVDGRWRNVTVITRIRKATSDKSELWLVEGSRLPKAYERGFGIWKARRCTVTAECLKPRGAA